jgi:acetyl-CoA carboxylase carboxyltransferase component
MKMEHVVEAKATGTITSVSVTTGDAVGRGDHLVRVDEVALPAAPTTDDSPQNGHGETRPELAELLRRRELVTDDGRPDAVARRHATGHRTARENVNDLCDPDSFIEYGPLVIAAQRARRDTQDLMERTPADGLVAGIGRVNSELFDDEHSRCAVLSYDYMVLAGTQGQMNHRKKDRLFELIERLQLPVVLFAEGGGGRPGDTDTATVTGLDTRAFALFGSLSGLAPSVGILSGRCFAGNAALLGCCNVIIATKDATVGMGGPAMIEGGGLGTYLPEEVGPMSMQVPNGVVDILVDDEAAAVAEAKRFLSYFQGSLATYECADQKLLRGCVPEDRRRVYDVHSVIDLVSDVGSVQELRPDFAPGMVTALVRLEGRPLGVIANNPMHQSGAIEANGADKAARFMQLCDAYQLPIVFLCDTPGFMVGPEAESTALVRHVSRMFVTGASLTTPYFTVILRKGYGLGAQSMAGGSFRSPVFTVAWPTGELGGMGLEGAVHLGYRRELDAIADPAEREAAFAERVARAYEHGKALSVATYFDWGGAHHIAQGAFVNQLAFQIAVLRSQSGVAAGAPQQHFESRWLNGLLQKPIRAQLMHGLHGGLDIAVRRQHDRRRHIAGIAQALQETEAVQTLHIEVGDNHIGGKSAKLYQSVLAIAGHLRGHPPRGNHGRKTTPLAGFVVHNENF